MPNYRMARFPIVLGLNIDALTKYLEDYSNKKLLQYLTYEFALSIITPDSLGNKNITNHFSTLQFPGAVHQCLQKKYNLGQCLALLTTLIAHTSTFQLLTRPKENNRRQVIFNLSNPLAWLGPWQCSIPDDVGRFYLYHG